MQTDKNFTPGPWRTDEEEYSQYVFGPDGEMICEMRGWGYLTGNRRKLSEQQAMEIQSANCRLIASAPSLQSEIDRLKEEKKEILAAIKLMHGKISIKGSFKFGTRTERMLKDLITRIK